MDKKELQKAQNIIDALFYDDKVLTQWQHTLLENVISIAQTKLRQPPVMCCGLPISCVNDFEKPEYCSQRNNHLCQKCKDW